MTNETEGQIILGIDPGYGKMGFGCIKIVKNKIELLAVGVATTPVDMEFTGRLYLLVNDITELIEKFNPDSVAIEKLFFAKNSRTAMQVAEARGAVMSVFAKYNLHVQEFTPAQIKKALTGDGKADKRAVKFMVKTLLNLSRVPRPDDAADALAVAITASTVKY
ncbi:MAG: crossover junction endodeoxyribonuclease RuvC [Patescibacteria group bacterium]